MTISLWHARATGEPGIEIVLPAKEAQQLWSACFAAEIKPCGLGVRNTFMQQPLYVDRRGSQVLVKHVKLPFVKNGQQTF